MIQLYIQTDRQLHWLCQIIAKANRAYVPAKEDDSHTNLYFDPVGNRIVGRWVETSGGRFLLALNLSDLHFEWLDDRQRRQKAVSVPGKDGRSLERDVARFFATAGLDEELFFRPLHYDIPDYGFQAGGIAEFSEEGLDRWAFFRQLANTACDSFLGFLQARGETRLWPHHFDTGVYAPAHDNLGIGLGLAMEDPLVGQPYFYLAGYPAQGSIQYTGLPHLSEGRWETGNQWQGAVLPLDHFNNRLTDTTSILHRFLLDTTSWFLEARHK